MRIAFAGLLLAACSQPAPTRVKPPGQRVARTPVSSTPTCADMGALLRGPIEDEDNEGPKKEALIVASCERDRWPMGVLECAASATEPTVQDCLAQLPGEMRARYTKALEPYAEVPEADTPDEETTCEQAIASTAVDLWRPPVTTEAERALATKLRSGPIVDACTGQVWPLDVRTCIANTPAVRIGDCLDGLSDAQRAGAEKAIEGADKLREKIVQAKPATVTCEKAVAAHYATAKWTGKAPELKGRDRTKAIAASKKAMRAACDAGWSIELRACIVAVDTSACHALGGGVWGYPVATSATTMSGIAECDDYGRAVDALVACPKLPEASRTAIRDGYEQAAAGWAALPPESIEAVKTACKAAADATREAARTCT